jgi:hypothetical protein
MRQATPSCLSRRKIASPSSIKLAQDWCISWLTIQILSTSTLINVFALELSTVWRSKSSALEYMMDVKLPRSKTVARDISNEYLPVETWMPWCYSLSSAEMIDLQQYPGTPVRTLQLDRIHYSSDFLHFHRRDNREVHSSRRAE